MKGYTIRILTVCDIVFVTRKSKVSDFEGVRCDKDGRNLPPNAPPPVHHSGGDDNDWSPFNDRVEFEMAEFIYRRNQMPADEIDDLMDLWASSVIKNDGYPPFSNHQDLYNAIDSIPYGDVPWQSFTTRYNGVRPNKVPSWMDSTYDVWFRDPHLIAQNMMGNPDFDGSLDYVPYREYNKGDRQFQDFMSGDWAWRQAVRYPFATDFYMLTFLLRMRLQKTQTRIRPLSYPSFLAATKLLFLSPPVKTNITHYICRSVMFTTVYAVRIVMRLHLFHSWRYRKVSELLMTSITIIYLATCSRQKKY